MRTAALFIVSVSVLLAPGARADEAPPEDYVDPCEEQGIAESEQCVRCSAPKFKDKECWQGAEADGKVLACRAWSYAIFCAPGALDDAGKSGSGMKDSAEKSGGCGCAGGGGTTTALPWGLALLALAALRRSYG